MAATSVSVAKNRMARAVESILDPWPVGKDPIWEFFDSKCAYCGLKLVKGQRQAHIDHATSRAGNHLGNLVLACPQCNGDEKRDEDWREFLERKVSDQVVRRERAERIERWQALHPKPELAASPDIAAIDSELRAMIAAFGERCADLRAAVAEAKRAAADAKN
jgi:5-methylcytosine-specific restriction endonuclease McrA